MGKIGLQDGILQKVEILCALKKLGEKLSDADEEFLITNMNSNLKQFEVASNTIGKSIYMCSTILVFFY